MNIPDSLPNDQEAMVVPLGVPMESEFALFVGPLEQAREMVVGMSPAEAKAVAIWTPGHVFTVEDLLAERPGHEHDPVARPSIG